MRKLLIILPLLVPLTAMADGTDPVPDRRGEAWGTDIYRGTNANASIPPEMRQRNAGGSNGAGLCVIASAVTNGRYQGIGSETEKLWEAAKRRPGGYSPGKLDNLIEQITPNLKYAHYLGQDTAVLDRLSRAGYPIGATMGTGRLYNYMPIAHMVSLTHFDSEKGLAAVVDNNKPEVTAWMPSDEFARRWKMSGGGWAFIWDYPPPIAAGIALTAFLIPLVVITWSIAISALYRRGVGLS